MNEGNWTEAIWLKNIIKAAIKEVYNIVAEVKKQESTNSQSLETNAKTYRDEIMTGLEGVQNLFKSSGNATLSPSQALAGKTYWNGTVLKTGTMSNKAGTTVKATTKTDDGTNMYLNIPVAGYYDTNSKIYTADRNIVYDLGTYTDLTVEIDVSGITGWEDFKESNFIVATNLPSGTTAQYDIEKFEGNAAYIEATCDSAMYKSYNPLTGKIFISPPTQKVALINSDGKTLIAKFIKPEIHVYLVIGNTKTL